MKKNIVLTLIFLLSFSVIVFAQSKKTKDIKSIAHAWAEANNNHDTEKISSLYAQTVLFYGFSKNVYTCMKEKAAFFKANKYNIEISGLDVDFYKKGIVKCNFTKEETWGGTTKTDQAYLLFEKKGNKYLITGESDSRMDSKHSVNLNLGEKETEKNNTLLYVSMSAIVILGAAFFQYKRKRKKKEFIIENSETLVEAVPLSENKPEEPVPKKAPAKVFFSKQLTSEEKGYEFEKWVTERFSDIYFRIEEWRSDKAHKGKFAQSSRLPDLELSFRSTNKYAYFAVECKWRQNLTNPFEWTNEEKLRIYKEYEHDSRKPVFVVLGFGGAPDNPEQLFVCPLSKLNSTTLSNYQLQPFRKKNLGNDFFYDANLNTLT